MDVHEFDRGDSDASEVLDGLVRAIDFAGARIHVLFGYHQSDIGKAELLARLGVLLGGGPDIGIIKVDGFLNTNHHGRHPSRTRNDFVVYRRFHDHIPFGGPNLILSGPLLIEFLEQFGESQEHLMFRPHVAKFFARRLFENWRLQGSPPSLLIEIGGNLLDLEVQAYIVPAIRLLKEIYQGTRLMLLAEAGYNREVIKTRPIINALETGRQLALAFEVVFARMHPEFAPTEDYRAVGAYVRAKISQALLSIAPPSVICVPYYADSSLTGYTEHLASFTDVIFAT
jgi:CTP synthase (UTP-ammonia lyase)